MNRTEMDEIAKAWIELHYEKDQSENYHKLFWAYSRMEELCNDEPEVCWEIINIIRGIDGSDVVLSNLSAGPLEDLLVMHGELFIDRIESQAIVDLQLKKILGAVWQNSISDSVWSRLKAVSGDSW